MYSLIAIIYILYNTCMILILAAMPTTMKVSLTKHGLQSYVSRLIDTAVDNFKNIDFPDIKSDITLGPFEYSVLLADIKVLQFDAHDFTFQLHTQQFYIRRAYAQVGFRLELKQRSYPYLMFNGYTKAYLELDANLDANFSLNQQTNLLEFTLMRIKDYIRVFEAQFEDQSLQVLFNAFKPQFIRILDDAVLPVVYKAISAEINRRLQDTYEASFEHGECTYNYVISEFTITDNQLIVGYPNWCSTAPNGAPGNVLINNYTNDDINYVVPAGLISAPNTDSQIRMRVAAAGIYVSGVGLPDQLCKLVVRSEKVQFGDMIKKRSYIDLSCPMAEDFARRYNENSIAITNTDFIEFTGVIYKDQYVVFTGTVQ